MAEICRRGEDGKSQVGGDEKELAYQCRFREFIPFISLLFGFQTMRLVNSQHE